MEGYLGFLVAGYALTWGVLGWYAWRLARRSREAHRALVIRGGESGVETTTREQG